MRTRPDMVLQFAHYLAKREMAAGQPRPLIYVDLRVSLNGRPPAPLIDPRANLADVQPRLGPADWITLLDTPLMAGSQASQ